MPALGKPTRPTSASNFSSMVSQNSSPGLPLVAVRGARLVEEAKWTLPFPPTPPRAAEKRWPSRTRSTRISPLAASRISEPAGTVTRQSSPLRPCIFLPRPTPPLAAIKWERYLKSSKEPRREEATMLTSPPLPPSPPSGPPLGTNFSRRKLTQPLPPAPARTKNLALSIKDIGKRMPR